MNRQYMGVGLIGMANKNAVFAALVDLIKQFYA
jgi:hypothetical protein